MVHRRVGIKGLELPLPLRFSGGYWAPQLVRFSMPTYLKSPPSR
jgi:hypothetical protein